MSRPTFKITSSIKPRVFMSAPTVSASRQLMPVSFAAVAAPPIFPPTATSNTSANTAHNPAPLINPQVVRTSDAMMELWDDCFSFPDLMVRVRRHVEIDVAYLDESGGQQCVTARGDLSELLQHEIDHLDGILATDRAIDARSFAMRNEALKQR